MNFDDFENGKEGKFNIKNQTNFWLLKIVKRKSKGSMEVDSFKNSKNITHYSQTYPQFFFPSLIGNSKTTGLLMGSYALVQLDALIYVVLPFFSTPYPSCTCPNI